MSNINLIFCLLFFSALQHLGWRRIGNTVRVGELFKFEVRLSNFFQNFLFMWKKADPIFWWNRIGLNSYCLLLYHPRLPKSVKQVLASFHMMNVVLGWIWCFCRGQIVGAVAHSAHSSCNNPKVILSSNIGWLGVILHSGVTFRIVGKTEIRVNKRLIFGG